GAAQPARSGRPRPVPALGLSGVGVGQLVSVDGLFDGIFLVLGQVRTVLAVRRRIPAQPA
ncbi:hypothetical protein ACFV5G_07445, partial [Streptomyces sp. NPDC059766]|uniref:hypothetical protein n=1 Tax=Streptomyces sp. NPDC059766 TaxID=3346940 RepID=UPI00365F0FCD